MQNFAKDKQEIEGKIKDKRLQLDELEREHRTVRARHGKESQRVGELMANRKVSILLSALSFHAVLTVLGVRKRYDRNANERDDLIRHLASQHNIPGFNGKFSPERVEDFSSALRDKLNRSKEECLRIEVRFSFSSMLNWTDAPICNRPRENRVIIHCRRESTNSSPSSKATAV